jgi:hypothetical protein
LGFASSRLFFSKKEFWADRFFSEQFLVAVYQDVDLQDQ